MAGRRQDEWDDKGGDKFLDEDPYDRYRGEDLSDDPMLADEKKKKKRLSRREERELERRRAEKEALRAEILAELEAERSGGTDGYATKGAPRYGDESRPGYGQGAGEEYPGDDTDGQYGYDPGEEEGGEKRPSRFSSFLMSFVSGNILSRQEVRRVYPYLLFIAFLAFVYIGNVFRMQSLYRRHDRLTEEVRELRAKSMTIASEKMRATRQSNIIREIERRGLPLKESLTPNRTIQR